jgi:hypothetical protein
VAYNSIKHKAAETFLQCGSIFTVNTKDSQPAQVCILGLYAVAGAPDSPTADVSGVFVACAGRRVDENGNRLYGVPQSPKTEAVYAETEWGPPMLSSVARFYNNKCFGCPRSVADPTTFRKALATITLTTLSSTNMQLRIRTTSGSTKFRETKLSEEFWQGIVPYEGRVVIAKSKHSSSNMDHSQPGSSSGDGNPGQSPVQVPQPVVVSTKGNTKSGQMLESPIAPNANGPLQWPQPPGNVALSLQQPDMTALMSSISTSMASTFKAATEAMQHRYQGNGDGNQYSVLANALAEANRRADETVKVNQNFAMNFVSSQGNQIQFLQSSLASSLKQAISSLKQPAGQSYLPAPAPVTPQSEPVTPAPEAEEGISAWLKLNGVAHTDEVIAKLTKFGVQEGADVLMLDNDAWKECGFKAVPVMKLGKLKAALG